MYYIGNADSSSSFEGVHAMQHVARARSMSRACRTVPAHVIDVRNDAKAER